MLFIAAFATGLLLILLAQGHALASEPASVEQPTVIEAPSPDGLATLPPAIGSTEEAKRLQLLFQSPDRGVSFHLRLGATYRDVTAGAAKFGLEYHTTGYPSYSGRVAQGYAPIGEAPCVATLYPGIHRMALALNEGYPLDVPGAVHLTVDSIVEGRYVDKERMRKAGSTIFFIGVIAGMVMMLAAASYSDFSLSNYPVFYTGLGVMSASIAIGVPLMTRNDEAYIDVYPLER